MAESKRPVPVKPDDTGALLAWFQELIRQARLTWRLLWDSRVPWWSKLVPIGVLAYVISPVDLVPGAMFPGFGQLDDVAVLLLGAKLFVELSPPDVVREHLRALGARIKEWRVMEEEEEKAESPTLIEGEFKPLESEPAEDVEGKPG
jgi:uncharacterized membrane protein YkvA (DUF1232 family)